MRKQIKEETLAQGSSPCRSGGDSLPCCAILESMTDGVFTVDLERRITTFFNRAAEEITGFAFAEAVNQFCFDILRSSTCQTNCPLDRTLKTGAPVYNHPAVIISRTGKEIPISVTKAFLRQKAIPASRAKDALADLERRRSEGWSFLATAMHGAAARQGGAAAGGFMCGLR
jgi:PAS domain S-box-containing protein